MKKKTARLITGALMNAVVALLIAFWDKVFPVLVFLAVFIFAGFLMFSVVVVVLILVLFVLSAVFNLDY